MYVCVCGGGEGSGWVGVCVRERQRGKGRRSEFLFKYFVIYYFLPFVFLSVMRFRRVDNVAACAQMYCRALEKGY